MSDEYIVCKYCLNNIKAGAKKCMYCHEWINMPAKKRLKTYLGVILLILILFSVTYRLLISIAH